MSYHMKDTRYQILHIYVRLALLPISQNDQFRRTLLQLMDKIIDHPMCETFAYDIRETSDPSLDLIGRAERTDESLASQLACAIVRNRTQRTIILVKHIISLTIDSRCRGKEKFLHTKFFHILQHMKSCIESQIIVHHRIFSSFLNIRVGSQMINHIKFTILEDIPHGLLME